MLEPIVVELYGDFACFSRPESKVERLTYPVITPSAARGVLSAIYSKPIEFYWQIRKIEVLNPIQYISFKRNEVKAKAGKKPILVEEERTQRQSTMLRDVRYRITADIIKRDSFPGTVEQLYEQARRRVRQGKCFFQPSLGLRECVCYFEPPSTRNPIEETLDFGVMLYDVFDLHQWEVTKKAEPFITLYHAQMNRGVIEVPAFDSEFVLKPLTAR